MKRLATIVCVLALASPTALHAAAERLLRSHRVADRSSGIDWTAADPLRMEQADASDNSTVIRSCWDCDSLYLLFEVRDRDLRACQTEKDHPQLFLDDMVEVLIDADNDKAPGWKEDDIVYHINILGAKKDDRGTALYTSDAGWDGRASYAVTLRGTLNDPSDRDEGYTVTMAIPWQEIGRLPAAGLEIGINFANGDNDGHGRQLYNWCHADPMRSPEVFGVLRLCDTPSGEK